MFLEFHGARTLFPPLYMVTFTLFTELFWQFNLWWAELFFILGKFLLKQQQQRRAQLERFPTLHEDGLICHIHQNTLLLRLLLHRRRCEMEAKTHTHMGPGSTLGERIKISDF